jgi:uncharacterized damage-inducible protein DinB
MEANEIRSSIVEIIQKLRVYGHWMVDNLTPLELTWLPKNTDAQTITDYFRHIVNAEIFWLKHLGDTKFEYESKSEEFTKLLQTYKKLENYLINQITNTSDTELAIRLPIYENEKLLKPGNISWLVLRTSLHAIHHFGQIAHIRYSINNPPNKRERKVTWGEAMDVIVKAMLI